MARTQGDKFAINMDRKMSGSMSLSGYIPRQGSVSGNGRFSANGKSSVEFEVTKANEGIAKELRASNISQSYAVKAKVSAMGQSENLDDDGKGPLNGREFTLTSNRGKWDSQFDELQGLFSKQNLFPEAKVSAGHKWEPEGDLFEEILDAMPDIDDHARGAKPDGIDVKVTFTFKGLTEYAGENCAVIDIRISGEGKDEDDLSMTASGRGKIYRSLDSFRNLKASTSIRVYMRGTERKRGARISMNGSMFMYIKEDEKVIHKAPPPPVTKEPEPKKTSPNKTEKE